MNVALTDDLLPFTTTTHELVPEHPEPDQPAKVEPESEVAVSVKTVRESTVTVQLDPQLIPEGLDVTVPVPEPDTVTVNVK